VKAAVPAQVTPVESPGALAIRREAQAYFDQARASFVARDVASSAKALRDAAGFFRAQAESASAGAQKALEKSASELGLLSADVDGGKTKVVASLDYVFARAQIAEARNHYLRANSALQKYDNARVGAELTMAVDHFQRAVKDGGETLGSAATKALADTRAAAAELMKGTIVARKDLDKTMAAFGKEIEGLGTKLERRKA